MALWIDDRQFVTTADLDAVDPEFSKSIQTCSGIVASGASGLISQAIDEAGQELERRLALCTSFIQDSGTLSANHLAVVQGLHVTAQERQRASIDQIVVSGRLETEWTPIKQWAVMKTLARVYRAAANSSLQDRFIEKQRRFQAEIDNAYWPRLKSHGIPMVLNPLPCPGAYAWPDSGSFAISLANGAGTLTATINVRLTYVDQSKYANQNSRANAESHGSAAQALTLAAGKILSIDFSNLRGSTGSAPEFISGRTLFTPAKATGINVWVSVSGGPYYLQNATPLPVSTTTWSLSSDPITFGPILRLGQVPDRWITIADLVRRG